MRASGSITAGSGVGGGGGEYSTLYLMSRFVLALRGAAVSPDLSAVEYDCFSSPPEGRSAYVASKDTVGRCWQMRKGKQTWRTDSMCATESTARESVARERCMNAVL